MRAVRSIVIVVLVLAGCSRSESATTSTTSTSTTTSTTSTSTTSTSTTTTSTTTSTTTPSTTTPTTTIATPTTVAATTTVAAGTTTTSPPTGACPSLAALPAGIIETAAVLIDVDADGVVDTVRSYTVSSNPSAGDWHVRVELAAGGGADLTLPFDPAPAGVTALGGAYVGSTVDPGPGGARPAIFVTVGAGAATSIVGLYRLSGCNLVAMQNAATDARFPLGATVINYENLRCEGVAGASLLVYIEATYDDVAMTHEIVETSYTRSGDDLVLFAAPIVSTSPTLPPGGLDTCGIAIP